MTLLQQSRKGLIALVLAVVMMVTTACGGATTADRPQLPAGGNATTINYKQLERGDTAAGQDFGNWVVQKSGGLIRDAYVRDDNKLGVVITNQVQPSDVRPLANSLVQGFRKNFPNRDLQVLVYAPDKKLILTANYNDRTNQIQYQ